MKKEPRKIKHWAEEAYDALETAWGLLREEYPSPDEKEKLELIRFAPVIAGMNRGVMDENSVKEAYAYVYERTAVDLGNRDDDEPIHFSVLFLLGYLESHISFGILTEKKVDQIMEHLSNNYDITYEPYHFIEN